MYTPTAAQATDSGAGPWPGQIIAVHQDGTVDLAVNPPDPDAVANLRVANVVQGGGDGQFALTGGPQMV
jgi:hypothetical protein